MEGWNKGSRVVLAVLFETVITKTPAVKNESFLAIGDHVADFSLAYLKKVGHGKHHG